jgi:tetratricopeptide (TPR) repeat protein
MSSARILVVLLATLCLTLLWSNRSRAQESVDEPAATAEQEAPAADTPTADETEGEPDLQAEPQSASPGQSDLDEATRMKLTATDGREIGKVIDLLNSAIKKGLDDDNLAFAKQMLSSTYMERAGAIGSMLLEQQLPDPAQNPQWTQLRAIALADLKKAVELDPAEYEGWLLIGELNQLPQGNTEEADQALSKVIEAEEADAEVKAEAYARRAAGREDEAAKLSDLTGAIEADPDNVEYILLRARHFFATKAYEKSLADVDRALEMVPDNYATHELRALVLLALDRTEDALASFDKATQLAPDAVTPYLRRSELYGQLGNMEEAIDQATKAIERKDDNPLGYLLRSDLYLRNDQLELALADADKALELTPGLVQGYFLKARVFDAMGRTADAMDQLQQLADGLPPNMELNLQIAIYALRLEMPNRAIAALDRAIEIEPDTAMLYRFRGDSYLNLGKHSEAIADYEKAYELDPEDSGVLNNLAWTLATSPDDDVRNGQRALELATKACEITEYKAAHIVSTLAAAHAELGDFEMAKEWARKAVELNDEENAAQISDELASYERGEPWRERQKLDSGEREGKAEEPNAQQAERRTELEKPSSSTPAPRRSIDF